MELCNKLQSIALSNCEMTQGIIVAIEMVRYELNIEVLIAFTVFFSSQKGHWTEQFQCLAI
jgi:hypothetical protein